MCSDIQKTEFEIRIKRFTVSLRQFFFENILQNTFSETFKLLLVITIRMTASKAEIYFLRNTIIEEKLTVLALVSIEKGMISRIHNFNGNQRQYCQLSLDYGISLKNLSASAVVTRIVVTIRSLKVSENILQVVFKEKLP